MIEQSNKNKARVMLVGMRMPPNYGREYTERFFGMYKALSTQYKAPLVPFMLEGVADKPALFQADRLHPSAQAHPIILANIWPTFSAMVKTR
jgi:acyl-CoA thioesterase-1